MKKRLFFFFGLLSLPLPAAVTVDFEADGILPFVITSGPSYRSAPGQGISSSKALVLANLNVATLSGPEAQSFPAGSFTDSAKITVGAFFKMTAFPKKNASTPPGSQAQTLRLGLTSGSKASFTGMPFASIEFKNNAGGAFVRVKDGGPESEAFTLRTDQWYYFETTFARGPKDPNQQKNSSVVYDISIRESSADGLLGAVVVIFKTAAEKDFAQLKLHDAERLDGPIFAGFRGCPGLRNGAAGVIDNFFFERQ